MGQQTYDLSAEGKLIYTGAVTGVHEVELPQIDKNEWGIDTLKRTLSGTAPNVITAQAALAQGATYSFGGITFYLQTWGQDNDPIFPRLILNYKGLRGGIPDPFPVTSQSEMMSSINADGLSVSYAGKTIVSATQEVKYVAGQTTWRYIASSIPTAPIYGTVELSTFVILDSRITIALEDVDGNQSTQVLVGAAPAGVTSALTRTPTEYVIGPNFSPIFGTPYYECEDQVQLRLPE